MVTYSSWGQDLFGVSLFGEEPTASTSNTTAHNGLSLLQPAQQATASLRILDKRLNRVSKVTLDTETVHTVSPKFAIALERCVHQKDAEKPGDVAWLEMTNPSKPSSPTVYAGWLYSAYPYYATLEHPRYDVQLLKCTILAE